MTSVYKIIAKSVRFASRLVGKKGTDLPGKVLRRINPNVLKEITKDFDEIVFVTGTNGKTTTSNLIGYTLRKADVKIVNNFEGANMLDGIISTFAIQTNKDTKLAIIEIDEGSIKRVMEYITPTKFVFNNFFRDQIDRFGEIDTLIESIVKQIKGKNIQLILNSDDPFVIRLDKYGVNNRYFGVNADAYQFKDSGITESKFCPSCSKELNYSHVHYSQMGIYACDNCDFKRIEPDYKVTFAKVNPLITISISNEEEFTTSQLGDFNIYNLLSAYATLDTVGLDKTKIIDGLSTYTSKNGRMQTIKTSEKTTNLLNLAKNPAGMNASLAIANSMDKSIEINYLLVLNDNGADGFDISWIWDTDFDILQGQNIKNIVCSGKRAKELALRLKYADIKANVFVNENITEAVAKLKTFDQEYNIVIPNYTALVETQKELESR
ncbi:MULTISPECIES: MurT ligase domain-containing protein [unclassified Gemella]|uniref:MurT ligase domain-containing protein n=1 Tax=unclassified Gemella TaxID=2624949 RepID=UPI0015CFD20D|nr:MULTISPECIES: MurT ligase domain-containing protein [unclassified Gemella]MBF0710184.1 DUF1727 domain-containing protein [Gemella sp. GL1.1]NYS27528.1 DUF1727 domain-containing protein [Gemella sp. GL1]